jgi:hypothetical protein
MATLLYDQADFNAPKGVKFRWLNIRYSPCWIPLMTVGDRKYSHFLISAGTSPQPAHSNYIAG